MDDFGTDDIAAMREQGDLPAFLRLRIRPVRSPAAVVALWQRFPGPAGHRPGAWPSAAQLGADYRRAQGAPELCDCARCLGGAASCTSCRCPLRGSPPAAA
ncbi:hypothetical protein [Streptomyces griseorubiginosus]|uniref:hypothetical protein n=1 Tax=Streptomyces griseorubiginosus TaxID=67304 RepID=UPI0036E223B4